MEREKITNKHRIQTIYKSDFICTYNLIEDYNDSLVLYQVQLLQAFDTNVFDDKKINDVTQDLYEKTKSNKYIINILKSDSFNDNSLFTDCD